MEQPIQHPGVPKIGDLFVIDAGDGDRIFFGAKKQIQLVQEPWFHGKVLDGFGEAMLFRIVDGEFSGRYIAAVSRVLTPIRDQFMEMGGASVIVWLVDNPSISFSAKPEDVTGIGMTFMMRISD